MKSALLTGLLAGLVSLTWGTSAPADQPKPQAYVVLVGISEYADPQIKPRPRAEADAKALYDLFTDPARGGVQPGQVRLLLGKPDGTRDSQPATRANVLKALEWAAKNARPNDPVIFAFLGQGGPWGQRVCYFASDSTFKDRSKNALAAAEIEQALENLKSQHFCALLDLSFKGFDAGQEKVPEPLADKMYQEFLGLEDDPDQPRPRPHLGRVVFLASDGFAPSLDLDAHGLFTQVVLDGLRGAADKEGYEPDGQITVEELEAYLRRELPRLARTHGTTPRERDQQPYVLRSRASNFVLAHNPQVMPLVRQRQAKLAQLAAENKVSAELAEEGRNLLAAMPKLSAQQDLRKVYQQLTDGKLTVEAFTAQRQRILDGMKLSREEARRFAARVIRATQMVRDAYVKPLNQGELVAWGIQGLYRRLEENIPSDLKERLDKAKELSEEELTVLLTDVRQRLGNREDLAHQKDLDITLQRMLTRLDPYTTYIDPEMLQRFQQDTTGQFTGIGIQINAPTRDKIQVITPLKGSPAYKAGLKAGDVITKIIREEDSEGKKLERPEIISTQGLPLNEAVRKILGKPGTKVKLVVEREGAGSLEFEITRDKIEVETVLGYKRGEDDEWDYIIDPANRIGYIRISNFSRNTARDLTRVLNRLERRGPLKGLVLDLRFNPGGLLNSAVEVADLFIDDGLIVTVKPRVGREQSYGGDSSGSKLGFPMVCLVNGLSASGSEIVAACLQDHGRAVIVGERSYGKGSVQNIQPFEGGEIKLTTASFWRPSGKNLNKSSTHGKEDEDWGVSPDPGFVIKLDNREREQLAEHQHLAEIIPRRDVPPKEVKSDFKDRQLEEALKYLRSQIKTAAKAAAQKTD